MFLKVLRGKFPGMPALELSILIPTYNEGDIIEDTLRKIAAALGKTLAAKTEVLIVDDGTDNLVEVVTKAAPAIGFRSVEVLRNSPPLGKGRSLARGFQRARGLVVGFLDADLSTPPSYILTAYDKLSTNQTDLFIGSRRHADAQVTRDQSALKDVLGNALSVVVNGFIFSGGTKYRDTQCGFKFFKNAVAKVLYQDLVAGDGLTDIEVLIRAGLLNLRVTEQGVIWNDLRESKRSLKRIFWGEVKSMSAILVHYKLFAGKRIQKLKLAAEKLHS